MEASDESIELLIDALLNTPLRDELDILFFVLIRDFNVSATGLEVNSDLFTKSLVFDRESAIDDVGDVVLHGPCKCPMEFSVHTLHVLQSDLLLENHLVESADEESIQEPSMENGQSNNTTNKFEVAQVLRIDSRMWVDLQRIIVVCRIFEQAIEGVEHLVR